MAKIVDPDFLTQGTEVIIDTTAKTIQLAIAGNLDDNSPGAQSGVTMQAVYSFLKEEWKDDNALNKFKFPLKAFTKNEFQWINGWAPLDIQTRHLMRDAGWQETVGTENGDLWAGFISLGAFDNVADQGYYQQIEGLDQSTTAFDKTGEVNEPVLIYDASGPTDYTGYFKAFLREQGKLYDSYDLLAEQGLATLEATLYRFPLSNATDLNISESDANIDANAPYTGMAISYLSGTGFTTWAAATVYPAESVVQGSDGRWYFTDLGGTSAGDSSNLAGGSDTGVTWVAYEGERQIGTDYYAFNRIVEGNTATRFQIYEWMQRQLRKTTDINTGAVTDPNQDTIGVVNGNIADDLAFFRGADLVLLEGVYIDNFASTEINNIAFQPVPLDAAPLAEVTFPFEVVVTLSFSQNIIDEIDGDTRIVVYFTNDDAGDNVGNDFDTSGAIIVQDNTPSNIDFGGASIVAGTYTFSFDYDGNVQRGPASASQDAPCTVQIVGLSNFEINTVEFNITRTATVTANIGANDERNYSNV